MPSNEDRGYVLRRIIRRALRHGHKLDIRGAFFHRLVEPLANEMGEAYPILNEKRERIAKVLLAEEERFAETLAHGMELLEKSIRGLKSQRDSGRCRVPAIRHVRFSRRPDGRRRARAWPHDRHRRIRDRNGEAARTRAVGSKFDADIGQRIRIDRAVEFVGYDDARGRTPRISRSVQLADGDVKAVDILPRGQPASWCSIERRSTPNPAARSATSARLHDGTMQVHSGRHHAERSPTFASRGDANAVNCASVRAVTSVGRRRAAALTALNHSATHLLHAALRQRAGHARPAEGFARFERTSALRLLAFVADDRGGNARGRSDREPPDPAEFARANGAAGLSGSDRRKAQWRCSAKSTAIECAC